MKVYIGPYASYFGPYQIAEKLMFWRDPDDDRVSELGDKLSEVKWLKRLCDWVYSKRERTVRVHVHDYDAWNADKTIAMIVLPLLKKVQESKHGAPRVDDEDVPDELKSTSAPPLTQEQIDCGHTDENWFKRWEWVIGEVVWTFEQHTTDWEEQYYSGKCDLMIQKVDGTEFSQLVQGPDHTFKVDEEGKSKHEKRMENGMRLFAKYYGSLWT